LSIIHCSPCRALFLIFLTFPPSPYLCDLVSLLLLSSWLEFLLTCACEFTRFRFCPPLCFSWLHFRVCFYLPSNTLSIFIYLSFHFSPCLYVLHFLNSISINISFCPYFCMSLLIFLFLSPYMTFSITVSSTFIHSLSLCVY
jgi:hypothetical protein